VEGEAGRERLEGWYEEAGIRGCGPAGEAGGVEEVGFEGGGVAQGLEETGGGGGGGEPAGLEEVLVCNVCGHVASKDEVDRRLHELKRRVVRA